MSYAIPFVTPPRYGRGRRARFVIPFEQQGERSPRAAARRHRRNAVSRTNDNLMNNDNLMSNENPMNNEQTVNHQMNDNRMDDGTDEEAGPGFGPPFRPGRARRGGRSGFGGPGFGPFPGPFGPPGHGHPGGRGRRGGRRGNVRAAVLALLAEEPRHGYAIMTELAERSGGLWRPSPGSVYPVLQQLQDEGLVAVEESEGRRVFSLTDAGRRYVTEHPDELHEPWNVAGSGPRRRVQSIMFAMQSLAVAAEQVARLADDAQAAKAVVAIEDARRSLYRILAGEPE